MSTAPLPFSIGVRRAASIRRCQAEMRSLADILVKNQGIICGCWLPFEGQTGSRHFERLSGLIYCFLARSSGCGNVECLQVTKPAP
jgi:hypothetical protein